MNAPSPDRIGLFLPVHRDEGTIERVARNARRVLHRVASRGHGRALRTVYREVFSPDCDRPLSHRRR